MGAAPAWTPAAASLEPATSTEEARGSTRPHSRGAGKARTTQNIISAETGLCADVAGPSTADGAILQTYWCQSWENQDFRLVEVTWDRFQLRAKHSGKCVGVAPGSGAGAAVVQQSA